MKFFNAIILGFTILLIVSCTTPAEDYERRAKIKVNKGDIEGALADFDKAIELKTRFRFGLCKSS